ncbi:MAG: MtnX-like HAD-IB family phosphatase [Firmicutes bacterium]|nr:MtnX-like HAD-IB family phosphatase [Bacillota bacterium]
MSEAFQFFCDFDGTIAKRDMITAIMREFAWESSEPIITAIRSGNLSVKTGVEQLFALLPSARLPEIQQFAQSSIVLREGFGAFCDRCKQEGWPLRVVSGGFDFFVETALAPYRDRLEIDCNRLDASGPYLRVIWTVPCDPYCQGGCGLCKPTVMRNAGKRGLQIVIGDGVTDQRAARQADFTFARDQLLAVCQQQGWPHAAFDNFYDVIDGIGVLLSDKGRDAT